MEGRAERSEGTGGGRRWTRRRRGGAPTGDPRDTCCGPDPDRHRRSPCPCRGLRNRRGLRSGDARGSVPRGLELRRSDCNNLSFPLSTDLPSSALTASSASRPSSNSTKAKPGGRRATQTFLILPYLVKAASTSSAERTSSTPEGKTDPWSRWEDHPHRLCLRFHAHGRTCLL